MKSDARVPKDFYMDHDAGREVLLEVRDVLNMVEVHFFLMQGTALGAYRDHGFVPTEKDIDLGIMFEQFDSHNIVWELMYNGFEIETYSAPFHQTRTIVAWKNGVKVDLVSWAKWRDLRFNSSPRRSWVTENYSIVHAAEMLERQKPIMLFDHEFWIPRDIEGYLALEYGEHWKTPKDDHVSRTRIYDFIETQGIPDDYLDQ